MRPRQKGAPQGERARIVARLIAAERVLPADPDRAALLLDGALAQLLDLWASDKRLSLPDALGALEVVAPAIAWRVRLALQAHEPSARLAHCWALLDLLTATTRRQHAATAASYSANQPRQARLSGASSDSRTTRTTRTNGASHVS